MLSYQSSHSKNFKSVLAEKSTKKWKSTFSPLRQKSYRVEIEFIGGSFFERDLPLTLKKSWLLQNSSFLK